MSESLFLSLDSSVIANDIFGAQHSVCYAAPGIQKEPADAMAALARIIHERGDFELAGMA